MAGARVGAESGGVDDVGWDSALFGEPGQHGTAGWAAEVLRAGDRVLVELIDDLLVDRAGRLRRGPGDRDGPERAAPAVGRWLRRQTCAVGEPVEGVANVVGVADGEEEVDGGAAVAASMAVPTFVSAAGSEHAERGCLAGLGVVGVGAGPHADERPAAGPEQFVGEGFEVHAGGGGG